MSSTKNQPINGDAGQKIKSPGSTSRKQELQNRICGFPEPNLSNYWVTFRNTFLRVMAESMGEKYAQLI